MKRITTISIILIGVTSLISCSPNQRLSHQKKELEESMSAFIKALETNDSEKLVEFLPDYTFDSIPKEALLSELNNQSSMPNPDSTQIKQKFNPIPSIDTIVNIDGTYYARCKISSEVSIDFASMKGENGVSFALSHLISSLKEEHGEEHVSFDQENWRVSYTHAMIIYGMKSGNENWKLFEHSKFFERSIPKSIRVTEIDSGESSGHNAL